MRAAIRTGLLGWGIAVNNDQPLPSVHDDAGNAAALEPNDILIKVKSAAINPVDYKLPRAIGGNIPGIDVSGVVEKVGSESTDFQVGDHVFGRAIDSKRKFTGSLADFTIVGAEEIAKKPEWLPFDEAAALPIAYLTGIQSFRAGNVKEGSSVLIIGASGGCGIAGLQLAVAMGASRVVGICSGKNFDFVRSMSGMGNTDDLELVDYTDEGALEQFVEKNAGQFDAIYDTATGSGKGEDYVSSMMKLLKEEIGMYVQINGGLSVWARHFMKMEHPRRKVINVISRKGRSDLEDIVALMKSSGFKPHLDVKSFDEEGVAGAFEQLKGRRTRGKIVFNLN